MSGSAQSVQVSPGTRHVGAAIVAVVLTIILAVIVVVGPLAAERPAAVPDAAPQVVTPEAHPGNRRRQPADDQSVAKGGRSTIGCTR